MLETACEKAKNQTERARNSVQRESAAEGTVRAGFGLGELGTPRNCLWRET